MPTIYLSSSQRLISSSRTWEWQLLKIRKDRKTKLPSEDWVFFRNYTSLESALNDVASVGVRTSNHKDVLDAISEVEIMMASLCSSLTPNVTPHIKRLTSHEGLNDG